MPELATLGRGSVTAKAARKAEKYARRQCEVLDAAAAVFAEKGYHGASTGDISARLGIRQGSLYYYFRSKEEALEQVCLIGVQGFVERVEAIAASERPALAKVRAAVTEHLKALERRRDYVVTFIHQRQHLPAERRRAIAAQSRRYERVVEDILRDGVEAGEIRADLDCRLMTLALIGMCNAVSVWPARDTGDVLDRVVETINRILVEGIRAADPEAEQAGGSRGGEAKKR